MAVACALITTLAGCTTIPRSELASYREAFDAARQISASIYVEYESLERLNENLKHRSARHRALTGAEAADAFVGFGPSFSAEQVMAQAGEPSVAVVRAQAWDVAARYNDALLAIAEGRSEAEIAGAVDGFIGALRRFPVDAVAEAAGGVVPFAGAIKPVIAIIERELEARRFREAVLAGAPLMRQFIKLLTDDANSIWALHQTASQDIYEGKLASAQKKINQLIRVAKPLKRPAGSKVMLLTEALEGARQNLSQPRDTQNLLDPLPATDAGTDPTPSDVAQLQLLQDAVLRHYATAEAEYAKLITFHEVMRKYVLLNQEILNNLSRLETAVQRGPDAQVTITNITALVASARQAYEIYRGSR